MGEKRHQSPLEKDSLLAQVLDRNNLIRALKQVKRYKGAAGIDGMTVEELPEYLTRHWPEIKSQLLSGHYRPQAVSTGLRYPNRTDANANWVYRRSSTA